MKKLIIKEYKQGIFRKSTHIQIIEQTHRGLDFSLDGNTFNHKGFELKSTYYPESKTLGLVVRGEDESRDNVLIDIKGRNKIWIKKMRAAVKAYNEYFSNCDICEDRKCNSCYKQISKNKDS